MRISIAMASRGTVCGTTSRGTVRGTTGGGTVCRTTRTKETRPLPDWRGGRERLWLSGGLVVPGVPEERHAYLEVSKEKMQGGFGSFVDMLHKTL